MMNCNDFAAVLSHAIVCETAHTHMCILTVCTIL